MDHLAQSMDSGVGPARGHNGYWMVRNPGQSGFQGSLHALGVGLTLPAVKAAPVIFQQQADAAHGSLFLCLPHPPEGREPKAVKVVEPSQSTISSPSQRAAAISRIQSARPGRPGPLASATLRR